MIRIPKIKIAENKKTGVEVFKKDGSHQKDYDFSE